MCQFEQLTIPSFLVKLKEILNSPLHTHIIRWDRTGQAISIVCIQALQEVVLPVYFRHSKFSSFVRQLNMYGFHKRKADKNTCAAFQNKYFTKNKIIFSAMSKKNKKQNPILPRKDIQMGLEILSQQNYIQHQFSTQFDQNLLKTSVSRKQITDNKYKIVCRDFVSVKKLPEVNQLIAELAEKAEPFLTEIDWLKSRQLELLLKEPRFQRVNFAVLGLLDLEQISPFADLPFTPMSYDKMELIL